MNSKSEIQEPENSVDEIETANAPSVDGFIKELEAKEKDLHITADYKIEIEESDFDPAKIPDFVEQDLPAAANSPSLPAGHAPGMKTQIYELEIEVDTLKARVAELRGERNEIQEKSDRRLKDFENYRYRMDRERRGASINQIGNLASQMLPVLDNLDRALDSIREVPAEKRNEFKQFFDGIELVNQQINEIFAEMGVQPIATTGETFDPNFHEAVTIEERDDLPSNTISAEMLRGYRIGNKVIRHSMVRVTTSLSGPNGLQKQAAEMTTEAIPKRPDLLPAQGDDAEIDIS